MIESIILQLVNFYAILLVVYVLMSWIPRGAGGLVEDVRHVLASVCEPYLSVFRSIIPPFGMIDFSPIIAILVLRMLASVVAAIL